MTVTRLWPRLTHFEKITFCLYVLAFLIGAYNHVIQLVHGGLFPYSRWWGASMILNVYWTMLTVLDPLAVLLLLTSLRTGCVLSLAIMVSDVGVNTYAEFAYWKQPLLQSYGLMFQTGFLVFLLLTISRMLRRVRKCTGADRPSLHRAQTT
ncbi:MAG TPA: hypothetical protein VMK12_04560 [Anaeromyxobacteraceae bacterium]|nr:hypothetical protein [Anaeromyxobacteraceae bacterium]